MTEVSNDSVCYSSGGFIFFLCGTSQADGMAVSRVCTAKSMYVKAHTPLIPDLMSIVWKEERMMYKKKTVFLPYFYLLFGVGNLQSFTIGH